MSTDKLVKIIDREEKVVFDNVESFISYLASSPFEDIMDLHQLSFSSTSVHFVYVLYCGQHIADSCSLESYDAWKASLT